MTAINARDKVVGSVTLDGEYTDRWGNWHGQRAHAALGNVAGR